MCLFVSQWVFGEEIFIDICKRYWDPHVSLQKLSKDKIAVGFNFISKEGESLLYSAIPESHKEEFYSRFKYAMNVISEKLGLGDFIKSTVDHYTQNGPLSIEQYEELDSKFYFKLQDYDSSNMIPLYARLSSLIFFNSWELIKHYKFIVYPKGGIGDE